MICLGNRCCPILVGPWPLATYHVVELTIFILLLTLNLNEEDGDVNLQEGSAEDVSGHVEKRNVITLLAVVHNSPTETGADGAVLIAPARERKAKKKSLT